MERCLPSPEENAKCKIGLLFICMRRQNLKFDNAKYWQGCKDKMLSYSGGGRINFYKHDKKQLANIL